MANVKLFLFLANKRIKGIVKVNVKAHNPGRLLLTTQTVTVKRDDRVRGSLVINVPFPPIETVSFSQAPSKLYTNTTTDLSATVKDKAGLDRTTNTPVVYESSDESIASFDELNNLMTHKSGRVTVTATAEGVTQSLKIKVGKNPARSVNLSTNGVDEIRTGDVLRIDAKATNSGVELLMMFQYIFHMLVNQNTANLDCQPPLRSPVMDVLLQRPQVCTLFRLLLVVTLHKKQSKLL